jgi:hypothetical protein
MLPQEPQTLLDVTNHSDSRSCSAVYNGGGAVKGHFSSAQCPRQLFVCAADSASLSLVILSKWLVRVTAGKWFSAAEALCYRCCLV